MEINTRTLDGIAVLQPKGRLTLETQPEFTKAVRRLFDSGQTRLVLDLHAVPYIDSCGLGAIAHAYVSARRRGGDLKLLHVRDKNLRILTVTKLLTVFEVYESDHDVVRGFDADSSRLLAS
jgi:anti-sigma B factor antagonist